MGVVFFNYQGASGNTFTRTKTKQIRLNFNFLGAGAGALPFQKARRGPAVGEKKNTISNPGWVWIATRTKFGTNSENRLRMGPANEAKHRKSLPNARQQGAPSAPPKGAALRAAPLGFVVCHLVRISYVLPHFPGPFWADFPNLFRIWSGSRSRPIQDFK